VPARIVCATSITASKEAAPSTATGRVRRILALVLPAHPMGGPIRLVRMARRKTVLVTGGSGFLGGWCVVELLRGDYEVRTTVRSLASEAEVRSRTASQVSGADERLAVLAADLTEDAGWAEAVAGCDYVLHVASPFPPAQPKDPDELIVPAREGTLRVLGAALDAGVERVVVTSSVAAIGASGGGSSAPLTEDDWTDESDPSVSPYARSKTIAERAAWNLARERGAERRLAVVNPGAIIGPVLSEDRSYSIEVVERLLKGMPGTPRIGFSCVDVRDVVELEIRAMLTPEAGGRRFIAVDRFLWMAEIAAILRDRLGPAASKVPTRGVPNFVVRAMALFDPGIRQVTGQLGRRQTYSHERAASVLGFSPRPVEDSIADCGQSLIDAGVIKAAA
jgi:dihydroflavonol-4-reductase